VKRKQNKKKYGNYCRGVFWYQTTKEEAYRPFRGGNILKPIPFAFTPGR
jgi:hypothetical protein